MGGGGEDIETQREIERGFNGHTEAETKRKWRKGAGEYRQIDKNRN